MKLFYGLESKKLLVFLGFLFFVALILAYFLFVDAPVRRTIKAAQTEEAAMLAEYEDLLPRLETAEGEPASVTLDDPEAIIESAMSETTLGYTAEQSGEGDELVWTLDFSITEYSVLYNILSILQNSGLPCSIRDMRVDSSDGSITNVSMTILFPQIEAQ